MQDHSMSPQQKIKLKNQLVKQLHDYVTFSNHHLPTLIGGGHGFGISGIETTKNDFPSSDMSSYNHFGLLGSTQKAKSNNSDFQEPPSPPSFDDLVAEKVDEIIEDEEKSVREKLYKSNR